MSLTNWRDNGWLVEHKTSPQEISDVINQFDKFRKKRNIGGYEAAGRISQQEADEMKKLAKELYEQIVKWLHQNHAGLIAKK